MIWIHGASGYIGQAFVTEAKKANLDYKAVSRQDLKQRQPDTTLARGTLWWAPTTVLRDGLTRTIEYFDPLLRAVKRVSPNWLT